MTEYVCQSQGHRQSFATPPGPDERCPFDQSALVRADGSPVPSPPPVPPPVAPPRPRPDGRLRPVVRLRIAFDDTVVTVERGGHVMLGRDPEYSPYGGQFQQHGNVSRRHAELGLDADGRAWIRDCYSTNLTRVNSEPLPPGQGRDLRDGSTVRLCHGVTGTIELIPEEPDGA